MSEYNAWNTNKAIKITKYLTKHKVDSATIICELESSGTAEIRAILSYKSVKPELIIRVFDCFDVFVMGGSKGGKYKRCWCVADVITTIKEELPELMM